MADLFPKHLFVGARLKVERAKTHFKNLDAEISAFRSREPYRLVHELDSDAGEKHIRVRVKEHPPAIWGAIIGDIVHNLRSALDLLATDLARAHGHTTKTALKGTYFPIAADRQEFETSDSIRKKIKRLSPAEQSVIRGLEPYKGGQGGVGDALWNLHQLDILDKHTLLVPAICSLQETMPALIAPAGIPTSIELRIGHLKKFPLEDGDILATYPASQPENSVYVYATLTIVFGEGQIVDGEPVQPTLLQFSKLVSDIIATYERRRSA